MVQVDSKVFGLSMLKMEMDRSNMALMVSVACDKFIDALHTNR